MILSHSENDKTRDPVSPMINEIYTNYVQTSPGQTETHLQQEIGKIGMEMA